MPERLRRGRAPTVSSELRDLRERLGWTQERASEWACGQGLRASLRAWQKWERAERSVPEILLRLMRRRAR